MDQEIKGTCFHGLTEGDLQARFGEPGTLRRDRFEHWMRGQTRMICTGEKFNHDTRMYEPDVCEEPHGAITYSHDVRRYLSGGDVFD